jgi:uncharacterized protein (TIGR02145 family)
MKNNRLILSALLLLGLGLTGIQEQQNNVKKTVGANITDIDGNVYHTVTIGTQTWMAENLKTTRYRNGDAIGTTSLATFDKSSERTPKYQCPYAGKESMVATYGRLYTWYALTDNRKVCPTGWHVSTDAEWTTLVKFLSSNKIALGKLKDGDTWQWKSPNKGATNNRGLPVLPAGNILGDLFIVNGEGGHYWTATESVADTLAWRWLVIGDVVQRGDCAKGCGRVVSNYAKRETLT